VAPRLKASVFLHRTSGGRLAVIGLLLVLEPGACAPTGSSTSVAAEARAVPVERESRHRPVFQTALVRILDVRVPAGDTTAYHVHAHRMVGVALVDARTWFQSPGAPPDPAVVPRAVPYVFDNWAGPLPYTHRVANVDTVPLHYLVAELLAPSHTDTPALRDTPARRMVKEGTLARVYQVTLAPHAATESHTHAAPGLTVLATAGMLVEEGSTFGAAGVAGPGRWVWRNPAHTHVLRNTGTATLTVYELDWR
jgi:hypothetical protein